MKSFPHTDTRSLREAYETHGYCIADGVYTEEQLSEIEVFFEDFKNAEAHFDGISSGDSPGAIPRYTEAYKTKRQVRALHPHRFHHEAVKWFIEPRAARVLEALLGKPPLGAQTMYYYKPPGSKGQGMHQDNIYLLAQPAVCIAAWTPIDDADLDNGCLYLAPGSHRKPILCPDKDAAEVDRWMSYGDSHITKWPQDCEAVPVPVKRGQTMFFHGHLIHGSGPNRTRDRYRRTFIGHYCDEATESMATFYHPVLNMRGEVVSSVAVHAGGGPCDEGWRGAVH